MKKIISMLLILTMLVSMVCISTSAAGIHIDEKFATAESFMSKFRAGAFFIDNGLLYGYDEARALQSDYEDDEDFDGIFKNTMFTWLTYDASITLSTADDDLSEDRRFLNLVYCNDNLKYMGRGDERVYMAFIYDIQERCFRITEGLDAVSDEQQLLNPVYKEISTDGEEFFTMGISVDKDRIRCFYNDELIFDFQDTAQDYLIAKEINSCFLFWQNGNFTQISNIKVADAGYIYPYAAAEEGTTAGGNDDANVTTTTAATTTSETTTKIVEEIVTNKDGETSIVTKVVTEATTTPKAETGNKPVGGTSTSTGDATFVVVAALVATLGCAVIVKKVTVR